MTNRLTTPHAIFQAEFAFSTIKDGPMQDAWPRGQFLKKNINLSTCFISARLEHGNAVKFINNRTLPIDVYQKAIKADGLMTSSENIALGVNFADCPSVLLFDPYRGLMALLHAGWRGIAGGIIENALRDFESLGVDPEYLQVYIGPSIRGCCYEVDADVATKIDGLSHLGKVYIDLSDTIKERLLKAGVLSFNITQNMDCTFPDNYLDTVYYSRRREGKESKNVGLFIAQMRRV